jgi:hypothetical protein
MIARHVLVCTVPVVLISLQLSRHKRCSDNRALLQLSVGRKNITERKSQRTRRNNDNNCISECTIAVTKNSSFEGNGGNQTYNYDDCIIAKVPSCCNNTRLGTIVTTLFFERYCFAKYKALSIIAACSSRVKRPPTMNSEGRDLEATHREVHRDLVSSVADADDKKTKNNSHFTEFDRDD